MQTLRQLVPLGDPAPRARSRPWTCATTRGSRTAARCSTSRATSSPSTTSSATSTTIALLKVNHLHLHLTDDQGWRIAIDSWPRLTEVGAANAVGGGPGGFYTQDDYRAIVAYAAARCVTIVPEIDMPGHTNAALASYAGAEPRRRRVPAYSGIEVGFSTLDTASETTYRFVDGRARRARRRSRRVPTCTSAATSRARRRTSSTRRSSTRAPQIAAGTGKTVVGWHEIAAAGPLPPGTVGQYWGYVRPETKALARGCGRSSTAAAG